MDGKAAAKAAIAEAEAAGGRICAFFAESILSCGGQVGALSKQEMLKTVRQQVQGLRISACCLLCIMWVPVWMLCSTH